MSDYKKDFEKSIEFIEWQNIMLRQQADRIAELEKRPAINKEDGLVCAKCYGSLIPKPLSDDEISQVYKEISEPFGEKRLYEIHDFARAIEERHGIK